MTTIFTIRKQLQAQVADLTKENEMLKGKITELEAKTNTGFSLEEFNLLKTEKDELVKQVDGLVKQLEDTETKMTDFDGRVADKVRETIAACGTPAVELPPTDKPAQTDLDLLTEYNALQGAERRKFWEKHQAEFYKLLRK